MEREIASLKEYFPTSPLCTVSSFGESNVDLSPLCRLSKPTTSGAMDSGAPPWETPSASEADDLHDGSSHNVCLAASAHDGNSHNVCPAASAHDDPRERLEPHPDDRPPPRRRTPPDEATASVVVDHMYSPDPPLRELENEAHLSS